MFASNAEQINATIGKISNFINETIRNKDTLDEKQKKEMITVLENVNSLIP